MDDAIERLVDYHGRRYWLTNGWSVRFRIRRVRTTAGRPHGLRYALTLHDVDGSRLLGFDNAHGVDREIEFDHEHRLGRVDRPVPFRFVGADALLVRFFEAVTSACETVGGAMEIAFEDTEEETSDGEENA